MGQGGMITPGAPGHRGLTLEVIEKTLANGVVNVKAAGKGSPDLEFIGTIENIWVQLVSTEGTSTEHLNSWVEVSTDGSSATVTCGADIEHGVALLVVGR